MTDHFFLEDNSTQNVGFLICLFKLSSSPCLVSQVTAATILFLQFMLYSSSSIDALKNEIPEAALELCQLKIKQLSPDILKFRTKDEDNRFTFNCSVVYRSFLFVFHAGSRGLGSNNSRDSSYKEKTAGSAHILTMVRLSLTSSEDVFKTSSRRLGQDQYICLGHMSSRRLQDVLKTSSRHLPDVLKTSSRCLQDIFKTSCKDIFKTFSRRTIKLICST